MTKTLIPPKGSSRMLAPTTTAKLARRMLCTSRVVADRLPVGLYGSPGLDILLALHIAEEDAQYLSAGDLIPPGSLGPSVTERWIRALEQDDLIERRGEVLALSPKGHTILSNLLEAIYAVQRSLD